MVEEAVLHDACNTVLVLRLGSAGDTGSISSGHRDALRRKDSSSVKSESSVSNPMVLPQSFLTLGLSDKEFRQSPAAVLFTDVKKEAEAESEEIEKIWSRGSDEDDEGSSRKKLRLTKEQSALLEERFKENSTLNPKQKLALAKQLKLRPRQVEVWFQNRRARTKLKQTEVDCEFLRRWCETLTDDNRRLQRELQDLKAVKPFGTPPPLYMQLPPAILKVCPSCQRATGGSAEQ
ncbi:Homeobox-leucine zipper protein HAT22 [Platanthera zijinensis]|uniref:Homeobox-leucine zipper protein HAT22 n=1 Tax=Platanthera zijinensis TaxID=2320716 RepID=A0AAP0GFH5_9ASPA